MNRTTQRAFWNGPPERLPDGFAVVKRKGARTFTAVCELWTQPLGWKLRGEIDGGGLQMSSVARSAGELLETIEGWGAAMIAEGWSDAPRPGADGADPFP